MRPPFVGAELAGVITSALDATAAKVKVADLTKQLDVQTHLASIGRMSAGLAHELANPLSVAILGLNEIRCEIARFVESERLLRELATAPVGELEKTLHAARGHLANATSPHELFQTIQDTATSYDRIQGLLSTLRVLSASEW